MFKFRHEEITKDGDNRIFKVIQITMSDSNGEDIGYLKFTYIPDNLSFFNFLDLKGTRFFKGKYGESQIFSEEDFSQIVEPAKRSQITYTLAQLSNSFSWNRSNELAKESTVVNDFHTFLVDSGILEKLHQKNDWEHKMYSDYFVNSPFVDFIRVYEKFQGKKNSIHLYREASRWLKERGMRLRLSGIVSDRAKAVRSKMNEMGLLDTGKINWYNNVQTAYYVK